MTPAGVSVVIPTCNRPGMLALTLHSVLAQRNVDMDVVIVDDGDSPSATALVDALRDPRVTLVRNPSTRGECAARNLGISVARREWIAFCDDDDLWAPDKLTAQLVAAAHDGAEWVYTGHVNVDVDLRILSGSPPPSPAELLRDLPHHNSVPAGASNVVVRAAMLAQVGPFDPGLRTSGDWDMWLRLARVAGRPAWVPRPLVALRMHRGMVSRDTVQILADIEVIARRHGIPVDRPRHLRWAAWMAMEAGDRGRAVRHYARAFQAGDWTSAARAVVALVRPNITHRRRVAAGNAWASEAQLWLDGLITVSPPTR